MREGTRELWELLSGTAVIYAGTVVDDGGGGGTVTQVAAGTVICRIDALGGREGEVAERISDRSTHLVTLPRETFLTTQNDLSVNGSDYEVTAVRENTDELARYVEVVPRA